MVTGGPSLGDVSGGEIPADPQPVDVCRGHQGPSGSCPAASLLVCEPELCPEPTGSWLPPALATWEPGGGGGSRLRAGLVLSSWAASWAVRMGYGAVWPCAVCAPLFPCGGFRGDRSGELAWPPPSTSGFAPASPPPPTTSLQGEGPGKLCLQC